VLVGAVYQVVALDGRDLNSPGLLDQQRVPLGMGQRADLVFTMPASGSVRLVDTELSGQTSPVQKFFTRGERGAQLTSVSIGHGATAPAMNVTQARLFDLTTYGAPALDPIATGFADQSIPMVLGSHPGMREGRPQLIHTLNGQASPDSTPISVEQGQIVRLHVDNQTAEYHPMHLHGHVMSVIARNGHLYPVRDGLPLRQHARMNPAASGSSD